MTRGSIDMTGQEYRLLLNRGDGCADLTVFVIEK
jgi:hypothetical protein